MGSIIMTVRSGFARAALWIGEPGWIRCLCRRNAKGRPFGGLVPVLLFVAAACAQGPDPMEEARQDAVIVTPFQGMRVSELVGREVVDADRRPLGTIQFIVQDRESQDLYAVIQRQGDPAQRRSVVALDDLRWDGESWRGSAIHGLELDRAASPMAYSSANFWVPAADLMIGPHGSGGGGDTIRFHRSGVGGDGGDMIRSHSSGS